MMIFGVLIRGAFRSIRSDLREFGRGHRAYQQARGAGGKARIEIRGVEELRRNLERMAKLIEKACRDEMDAIAVDIERLSRQRAPIDEGDLEGSHRTTAKSRPHRYEVIISVGDGLEYAQKMHWGHYKLGPRSAAKNEAKPGVGPLFFQRSFDEIARQAERRLRAAAGTAAKVRIKFLR